MAQVQAQVRTRITSTWRRLGLPFVEPGVRLVPRALVPEFEQAMELYRQELRAGVEELAEAFPGREIVRIDCRPLIWQNGSLHCVTMQLPEGLLA